MVVFIPEKLCEDLADCYPCNRFQYSSDMGKSIEPPVFLDIAIGIVHLSAFLFWNLPASPFTAYRKYDATSCTHSKKIALVGHAFVLFLRISF
jgi:hypothetical protein